jgi:hypothetical protein
MSGILARLEAAAVGIGILHTQLLPIEWPNLFGGWGNW